MITVAILYKEFVKGFNVKLENSSSLLLYNKFKIWAEEVASHPPSGTMYFQLLSSSL